MSTEAPARRGEEDGATAAVQPRSLTRRLFSPTSRGWEGRLGIAFALPAIAVFLGVLAYPIFENVRSTFYAVDLLTGDSSFIGFDNLREIARDDALRATVGTTLIWTVGSLAGQILLGLAAALLIDRPWPGMHLVRQLLLIPYVVPVIATALVWQWMLDGRYGIVGAALQDMDLIRAGASPLGLPGTALLTVIVINVWRGFPFAMLVYWATLQNIDQQQYEAAKMDGAGPLREFWSITLPNLRNATIALLALRGVWTLMYFELIWLTTRGGPVGATEILPTFLYKVVMGEFRLGYAAAIATVTGIALVAVVVGVYAVRAIRRTQQ